MSSNPSVTIVNLVVLLCLCLSGAARSVLKSPLTRFSTPQGIWMMAIMKRSRVEALCGARYQPKIFQQCPPVAIWNLTTFGMFRWSASTMKRR